MLEVDRVVREVDDRALRLLLEEVLRMAQDVLVQRRVAGDEHGERLALVAPRAAEALPERLPGSRIPHEDRAVDPADVDADLERAGRRDAVELPIFEPVFRTAP